MIEPVPTTDMAHSIRQEISGIHLATPDKSTASNNPLPIVLRGLQRLDMLSPWAAWAAGGILIVSIGILSYVTGPEFNCALFYLIPILLITRVVGLRAGAGAAIIAATIWLIADLNVGLDYGYSVTPYWNALMRFGTFLVAACLVSAMSSLNDHLEERVRDRTAALESQISETRELEKNILEISDRERAAIGQDLHDGLCQQLVSAAFSTNLLHGKLSSEKDSGSSDASKIADMIDEAINQARGLARGLYPVRLESDGLEMALRELVATTNRRFDVNYCSIALQDKIPACSETTGIHLYRIAQEAVTNAAKHANASKILIHLSADSSHLLLKIQDDGVGIDRASINPQGMGLNIMEYRARLIGADFRVIPLAAGGTEVICKVAR